jgi:hypothetical protein
MDMITSSQTDMFYFIATDLNISWIVLPDFISAASTCIENNVCSAALTENPLFAQLL